jgi:hypothetical protein
LHVRRIRIDEGGYDENGTYFGSGDPLFWFADGAGDVDAVLRAKGLTDAMSKIRETYPLATFPDDGVRREITDACAWILWAQAWISYQEELGEEGANPGAGGSWDPYVPDVPEAVMRGAEALIASVERLNGAPIEELFEKARAAVTRNVERATADRFGTCLGYQAAGAGIGVRDDFPEAEIKVPEISVNASGDTEADVASVDERFAR